MIRRDVVSVSRRSECHETCRCNCRFGCSSAAGAVVGSSSFCVVAGTPVSLLTVFTAAAAAAASEESTAATSTSSTSVRSGRGYGERGGEEGGNGAAAGPRVERKGEERVRCMPRKSLHGGSTPTGDADADASPSSENVRCSAERVAAAGAFQALPPGASPNDDDEGPRDAGPETTTSDAGPRA